jgi:hypothetical protein
MTNHLADAGAAIGLCELGVARQCIDDIAGEPRPVRGCQTCAMIALEVIPDQEMAIVPRNLQVQTGPLEVSRE